ncbi:MAG: TauD/TfdA family dioxygenase [Acidimicrobiales bacterium]|nr:TauD/TfdA family dioxygenase [Acidimicrobiales bacterium]
MSTPTLQLRRLSGHLAAEVANPLAEVLADPALQDAIRAALPEHGVLVLPAASPTPAQQIALAEVFGEARPPLGQNPRHPDNDLVCVFDSDEGYRAEKWHTDETFVDEPCTGAVLSMQILPEVGGDTLWTSTAAAYDALSNGMKELLSNRRARHEINESHFAVHPVVQTHPVTGRKLIYVNEIFTRGIVNLPPGESSVILPFLIDHVQQPQFTFRHTWAEGDVVIWDNRSTQHIALSDFQGRRVVHRVEFHGEPFADAV